MFGRVRTCCVDDDVRGDGRRLVLAHLGRLDLDDVEALHGVRHARPAVESHNGIIVIVVLQSGAHAAQHVRDVLPDLVRGLQPEQVEVAQQVVVDGQELQVQLGQRQAGLACAGGQGSGSGVRIGMLQHFADLQCLYHLADLQDVRCKPLCDA